ncbi:hypothetical protein SMD22_09895 [Brevibacillus halotolerans]|nr:hypothetical protein SMD22_09895 [Brevibacillus halotolerans]
MADMLPKLFFEHFTYTASFSFIAEKNGELLGFLIGFLLIEMKLIFTL